MNYLTLDDATKERLRALAARAERPENWCRPGEAAVPGDSPKYREFVGSYRVVYSITVIPGSGKHRHLTVSTASGVGLPAPFIVFTIAHWLGFTGVEQDGNGIVTKPPADRRWEIGHITVDKCIAVAEPWEEPSCS